MTDSLYFPAIIIGGGIAGLVTLHRLHRAGIKAILLESEALGAGQTICSQGIIHGGLKYAFQGVLTKAANAMATMPDYWKRCLAGEGELPLQGVKRLSNYQYLWSAGSLADHISTFFASKSLKERVQKANMIARPAVFQHEKFKGQLYCLEETVLDIQSIIQALFKPLQSYCFKIDRDSLQVNRNYLNILVNHQPWQLHAQQFIFTAGENNEQLIQNMPNRPDMQRRSLHMVVGSGSTLPSLYGHCIGRGSTVPKITITTHTMENGTPVWYIGGQIAEQGVNLSQEAQVEATKEVLTRLLPWVSLENTKWASFKINRAEFLQESGQKPEKETVFSINKNITVAWPTKLVLAPKLAEEVYRCIQNKISLSEANNLDWEKLKKLPQPTIAPFIWNKLLA